MYLSHNAIPNGRMERANMAKLPSVEPVSGEMGSPTNIVYSQTFPLMLYCVYTSFKLNPLNDSWSYPLYLDPPLIIIIIIIRNL